MIKYETDSRLVNPNQTFVAIVGHNVDGHDYIEDAIKNGATHIVVSKNIELQQDNIVLTKTENTEKYLKERLIEEYSQKISEIKIIGVTGTNGKTTTCYLTYQLLQRLNINVAYIGTIGYYHKDEFIELENTTPDILNLYKLFYNALEKKCTHIVMEVSSHALSFERVAGLKFSAGAFTNLTQDHLDYHETMENYLNEKLKLTNQMHEGAPFIVNSDDSYGDNFVNKYSNCITIGSNEENDYFISKYKITAAEIDLQFNYKNNTYNALINLTSKFNIYNYLTALALLVELGFDITTLLEKSKLINPPKGRCETIKVNNGYAVIDYAHTPDAVEKVITAYNELKTGKVITIVGCGGDRDPKKRPLMGGIASRLSDYTILTSDNPRTENPDNIMNDIIKGVESENYEVIMDRKDAIKCGIEMLNKEDILLILGKGHEDYQIIGHTKHHLDDSEEVLNWIKNNS